MFKHRYSSTGRIFYTFSYIQYDTIALPQMLIQETNLGTQWAQNIKYWHNYEHSTMNTDTQLQAQHNEYWRTVTSAAQWILTHNYEHCTINTDTQLAQHNEYRHTIMSTAQWIPTHNHEHSTIPTHNYEHSKTNTDTQLWAQHNEYRHTIMSTEQ
jgi:hypothetical protein